MSYYTQELEQLLGSNEPEEMKIKITGNAVDTKWFDLNLESIDSLEHFLTLLRAGIIEERAEKTG